MGDVKNIGRADVRKVKMKPICSCIKQIPCAALWHKTAVLGFPGFKSCEDNTQRLEKHATAEKVKFCMLWEHISRSEYLRLRV